MTREQAKQALAATFGFKRVGDQIALRELRLIEEVLVYETKRVDAPNLAVYQELHPSRPS